MIAPLSAESFAALSFTHDLIQLWEAHSRELQGLSGPRTMFHLPSVQAVFTASIFFPAKTVSFLKSETMSYIYSANPNVLNRGCRQDSSGLALLPAISVCVCVLVAPSWPTLCDPTDYSLSGSSVHGTLQGRILERVAISFSRGSSRPRDWTQVPSVYLKQISFTSPSFSVLIRIKRE